MASDYRHPSPDSDFLAGGMASTSVFGGGSRSGSETGFDTPQSLSLDTLMQDLGNSNGILTASSSAADHRSGPASAAANMRNFGGARNSPALSSASVHGSSAQQRNRPSAMGLHDETSPVVGSRRRLSMSSSGHFAGADRQNSMSETTSVDGQQGQVSMGSNAQASNSTDNVIAQGMEDATRASDMLMPTWSELKTKAGKERKRLPLACIACRRKKIRCSGEKPSCKHCVRSRIPCVYKVTTRKAAPRTDYMAMLDKRLRRMEERVIKIIPKDQQGIVNNTGRAVVRPPLPPPPAKTTGASKKRGAEQAFGNELDEWASATAPSEHHKQEVTTQPEPETDTAQTAEERNMLLEGADALPSKDIQEHLSEIFFDYVYGQSYHLLHKPSFMRKLGQGTVPPVLMLAVCAISARFSNHPSVRTEPAFLRGEEWASVAREIALKRYDTPNITILIVYLILGLHEFGTCQGGRSWMFGGMAQRMAYALQLHKDLDHDPKLRRRSDGKKHESDLTFTDREIRRRTMWSCFLMDRFNSSGTDRPIFVSEQYIRAQLPIKENYYQMEITGPTEDLEGGVPNPMEPDNGQPANAKDNMGVAAHLVRLVAVWGRLVHYLNLGGKDRDKHAMWSEESTFQSIKRAAEEWKQALPASLQYTPDNLQTYSSEKIANQFLFLHIVYNQIILFMNRFALPTRGYRPKLPTDMPKDFVQSSSRLAFEAANQISALIHESMDHCVVAPFAGYCAFLSSTVHIHGAFSKNVQLEANSKQNLAWNVKYLTKMKKYWGMFHFVTENLRDLYRRHADAARANPAQARPGAEDEQDTAIFQYGDWFDRYPHGVSGTDYEEPSTEVKREPGADAVLGQKSDLQSVEDFFSKMSPPSRAAHSQRLQQQVAKKNPKKRRASKSESKLAAEAATGAVRGQQQQSGQQSTQNEVPQGQGTSPSMMSSQSYQSELDRLRQHSAAFPPGFQAPHNPLLMNAPQHVLSQLDRQMVLNSYAGMDHAASNQAQQQAFQHYANNNPMLNHTATTSADLDPFNLDAFAHLRSNNNSSTSNHTNGGNDAGFWGDPSTAWFMPFNMEPPSIGEDSNLFTSQSGFDWTNFNAMGDLAGMPSTGMTPGPVDIDSIPDGSNGMDGFGDGM